MSTTDLSGQRKRTIDREPRTGTACRRPLTWRVSDSAVTSTNDVRSVRLSHGHHLRRAHVDPSPSSQQRRRDLSPCRRSRSRRPRPPSGPRATPALIRAGAATVIVDQLLAQLGGERDEHLSAARVLTSSGPGAASRTSGRPAGAPATVRNATPLGVDQRRTARRAARPPPRSARPPRPRTVPGQSRDDRRPVHGRQRARPGRGPRPGRPGPAARRRGTAAASRTCIGGDQRRCRPPAPSRTPSTAVPYTIQASSADRRPAPGRAATAQGSAARSRRCRARAMNRRTDGGTASVSARTSRQLRAPLGPSPPPGRTASPAGRTGGTEPVAGATGSGPAVGRRRPARRAARRPAARSAGRPWSPPRRPGGPRRTTSAGTSSQTARRPCARRAGRSPRSARRRPRPDRAPRPGRRPPSRPPRRRWPAPSASSACRSRVR